MIKKFWIKINKTMKLKETADMMCSADYKERFKAEYYQLKIRFENLKQMCEKWDNGKLNFAPMSPRGIYNKQLDTMNVYLYILKCRAEMENIKL